MTDDSLWARADSIFDRALDLEGDAREDWIVSACKGEEELEALVRRLLANSGEGLTKIVTGGALDSAFAEQLRQELAEDHSHLTGTEVGRYTVLEELGRGGMAVVYLAERADDDFHHQVALKLLQTGSASDDTVRRFLRERQILAQSRHPGIAQLLDGGVTDDGRPYLVMEYVDGQPIDVWADERRLTVEYRLRLFLKVARSVSYAHRNLVVHRDIKPSNILVTDDGDVKLLDFGIAKLLDDEEDATKSMLRAMTPAFASPEQIRGEPITTATDVYQLGMLLYLLLTGRWPYRGGAGSDASLLMAICESPPMRPSAAVSSRNTTDAAPGLSSLSAAELEGTRRMTTGRLRREMSGDLDTIVLTALRKEPERRYASVGQFVTDVERYLAGRTVAARPETIAYRVRKFVARHRVASAVVSAAIAALVVVTVLYTVRLEAERDHARSEAAKANEIADFLRGLFEVSAPTRAKGEAVTARELLDRGAERLDQDLSSQPELRATMATLMGEVYSELAHYEEARALLEQAVETRRETPGVDDLGLADALAGLGKVCERIRDIECAEPAYREAVSIREAAFGPHHAQTALARDWLGVVLYRDNHFDEARELIETALVDLETAFGPDSEEVGNCLNHLGIVMREQRLYEESLPVFERAMAILDARLDEGHPVPAAIRVNYADSVRYAGDPERADSLYSEALPRMEKAYGEDHPYIGIVLTNHANLLRSQERFAEAEELHLRALEVFSKSLGEDHVQVSWVYNNLGLIRRDQGDHAAALDLFEKSVDIVDRTLGPDDGENAIPVNNMARELAALDRSAEALPVYQRALRIHEATYGPDNSYLHSPLMGIAGCLLDLERPEEAVPYLRRAVDLGRDDDSHRLSEIVEPMIMIARCLALQDHDQEAAEVLDQAEARGGPGAESVVATARDEILQ